MDSIKLDTGGLLSFSLNKQKEPGVMESLIKGKRVVEVLVRKLFYFPGKV
jgi:hypothetical protein